MLFFVVLSMVARLAAGGGGITDLVHSKWDFILLDNVPLFNFVYFSFQATFESCSIGGNIGYNWWQYWVAGNQ